MDKVRAGVPAVRAKTRGVDEQAVTETPSFDLTRRACSVFE